MFYYISGKIAYLDPTFAVVDAGGVGYKMTISQSTYSQMPPHRSVDEKPNVTLYTYMAVREDGIELFGFATTEELDSFKLLITVSGVGPKAAISILSLLSPGKLAVAICTDDKKTISKANGVGPKTAARIVLELKDKLKGSIDLEGSDMEDDTVSEILGASDKRADALSALTVLGYTRSEAESVIKKIDISNLEVDDIIREALKKLMK
ncbi:MAG: Holliday junction branch migration protein RuvA [Ruminococcaceae bacterium]|nr:Holliday junction branch migration protein RuvA [Oscillospiraceae bacterium]